MQPLRFGRVLEELEGLLDDMATQCHAIEDMAVLWSGDTSPNSQRNTDSLIAFQKLDLIAQSLHDLSGLAGAVSRTRLGTAPVDVRYIRDNLRLTSLADRLLGQDAHSADGDEFLL